VTYTHAIQFNASGDSGSAPADAAYNDLALLTVGLLVRYNGATDATLWSKGNNSSALHALLIGSDGRADYFVQRSSTGSIWRGNAITVDNTWRWVFFTLNRSTGAHTRIGGPKGGTLVSLGPSDINGGSGTVNADAAFAFTIGGNGTNGSAATVEYAFVGIWNSVLSTAQCQAVADDLTLAVQPVAAWKPDAGSTASIANYISGPPAMTLTGTTVVAGPDTGGGSGLAAVLMRRRLG
jgi:hypothetical protein